MRSLQQAEFHAWRRRTRGNENVDTVVIDGRVVKRGGKLVAIDGHKVVAEARVALAGVRERAKWR